MSKGSEFNLSSQIKVTMYSMTGLIEAIYYELLNIELLSLVLFKYKKFSWNFGNHIRKDSLRS